MQRRFVTTDVFTDRLFGGNPLAVVLDAAGLSSAQMQIIASEFNYSETTFILPPRDPAHTAWVRIFTVNREVPFAGHPNVGAAFALAQQYLARGEPCPEQFVFEEAAGLVPVRLLHDGDAVTGAELLAPEPLSRLSQLDPARAAACLSLRPEDIRTDAHAPEVASVGLPFLIVELATRDALRRARPDRAAYDAWLPLDGAVSIYTYTREADDCDLQARMFMPRLTEDPATGSATAVAAALLAALHDSTDAELRLHVRQGVDMGRPSQLLTRVRKSGGAVAEVRVGGVCVAAMQGHFHLPGAG